MSHETWNPTHIQAWCCGGGCQWAMRFEQPLPDDTSRVTRAARAHAAKPGHDVSVERGSTRFFKAPEVGGGACHDACAHPDLDHRTSGEPCRAPDGAALGS